MPEVSEDAVLLIATSFQALNRIKDDESARICNCAIVIVFAGFYVEANLTSIIDIIGKTGEMENWCFPDKKDPHPGLRDKLAWFYQNFVDKSNAIKKSIKDSDLNGKFPGFIDLWNFRNNLAHGKIDKNIKVETAKDLRIKAKKIVDELFDICKQNGHDIERITTYQDVINSVNVGESDYSE